MVNNNFTIIGTAITNFVDVGSNGFDQYAIRVEVDGYNGKATVIEVKFSPRSKGVDIAQSIVGCTVVVGGQISTWVGDKGVFTSLQGNTLLVVRNVPKPSFNNVGVGGVVAPKNDDSDLPF